MDERVTDRHGIGWMMIIAAAALLLPAAALAADASTPMPWSNPSLSPDQRARLAFDAMSPDERNALLHGIFAVPFFGKLPAEAVGSAGYVSGIPRLGIPALQESDASLGVANPFNVRPGDSATPLPSGLALAATWNQDIAYQGGAMIADEARRKGLNVLLAGGGNLARDPRNGRNFEYLGEDPLLAGTVDGASIRGIQDQHVASTMKHFALNDQETGRMVLNATIGESAFRESDLLAFELAVEIGHPASVMCSYNRVDGDYACGNDWLLNTVLKGDWAYPGWVMSDWGAVHDVGYAKVGLDQESGAQLDKSVFFDAPLKQAAASGTLSADRLSDMTRRVLRGIFAVGLFDHPPVKAAIDAAADAAVAQREAEEGIVLLANPKGLLPLKPETKRILVIGGHADSGVLSGGGSSQVTPVGGPAPAIAMGGEGFGAAFRTMVFDPSSPFKAIKAKAPKAEIHFYDGRYPSAAAALARKADVVVIFATQWMIEGEDAPDLTLPEGQDALIAAVAAANPNTVVVLETGGPVLMPWLSKVGAVLEAWYPGAKGGDAIANILFGDVNPSGRLPVTFPVSEAQLPRPAIPGWGLPDGAGFDVDYAIEGSDVGYRWFARQKLKPLFAFGYGLSFTRFDYANLKTEGGDTLSVTFDVHNVGDRSGTDVAQLYLTDAAGKPRLRLLGWSKLALAPGATGQVALKVDPRLLADFDEKAHGWRVNAGKYGIAVGASATDLKLRAETIVSAEMLKP